MSKIKHTLYCHKYIRSFILVSIDKYNDRISTGSRYSIKECFTRHQSTIFYFPGDLTLYDIYQANTIEELKEQVIEYLI